MLYDLRIYACRPGTVSAHLELYGREDLISQEKPVAGTDAFL